MAGTASREYGGFVFSNNFEIQIAAPLDARTVAKKYWYIKDLDFWKYTDGSYYLYKGIVVSVYEDGLNEGDDYHSDPNKDENGLYMFIGNPYETDSSNSGHFSKDENWKKIGNDDKTSGVIFDFLNNGGSGEYTEIFSAPYDLSINSWEFSGTYSTLEYEIENNGQNSINDIYSKTMNQFEKLKIIVKNPNDFILKLNIYKI